jgi:hypothetical protein
MKRAEQMTRLMETVESQPQAFHRSPKRLEISPTPARFPHSLSSDDGGCNREPNNTYYRCLPRLWVTSLSDPTDIGLGYLLK